ncbi:hypothetical protein JY651_32070 [Pyxidicoccus parkwayensis]|uniref:Lipoprotein n=1 Tax=Pyxidicoccus parkwayensis TaxID=2813578 RepID=A0ABX7NM17_9BACT|nr:hypothetical protein [Pyxidicoccus parkwaysis]QSQ19901.1 hypothetical protein JY651_32070 [Pyxidicoccus parkwaysis]
MLTHVRLLPLALLVLVACKSGGGDEDPDAGSNPVEDLCNSREEALTLAECELKPGAPLDRFLVQAGEQKAGDQDWYRIVLPADTSARTLLNVNGAYLASSTAVNLSITVLETLPNGTDSALVKKEDKHGQGAPRPVDMVVPLRNDLKSKTLLVLVQDSPDVPTRPNYDAKSPYRLKVEIATNPDTQEPNDTPATATPLTLTSQNGMQVGTATGYLATDNDVDNYTFDLAAGKIAYVHLVAPDQQFVPNWRLAYELRRPGFSEKEDEGQVPPQVRGGQLATARKVKAAYAGKWLLVVKGYRGTNDKDTASGDLRQPYQVEVRVMDEQDAQDTTGDGNDTVATATARSLESTSPGTPQAATSFTGRLGYVPDTDWYSVRLPASTAPTLLRYRLSPLGTGGRFPALPDTPDRMVQVFTLVTKGANLSEWRTACLNDVTACPKGYGENPDARQLVEGFCSNAKLPAPMCTHSYREEAADNPRFTNLSNFRGVLPVPPHAAALTYYFVVQDVGTDWADDRDYRLDVSWDTEDADEVSRYSGGVEQPVARTLASTTAYPAPPDTAEFSVSGQLSAGYGRLRSGDDRVTGFGVRGPADYDGVPSDVDSYQFQLPSLAAPEDRAWLVQWEVEKLADGGTPHGLALDLTFCDGDVPSTDGGSCTQVTTGSRNAPLTLGYRPDALRAWHSPTNATLSSLQPQYTLEERPNSTVVTLAPYACGCLERRFIHGGTMRVDVSASERLDYERVNYTLRTGYGAYPQSYTVDGGASVSCPAPGQDGGTTLPDGGVTPMGWAGGCIFTRQP